METVCHSEPTAKNLCPDGKDYGSVRSYGGPCPELCRMVQDDNGLIDPREEEKMGLTRLPRTAVFKRQFGNAGFIELPFSLRNQSLVLLPGRLG